MIRNKFTLALLFISSITTSASFLAHAVETKNPSSQKFEQLLDDHWQSANKEQVLFLKDPDTFRIKGKLPSFLKQSEKRRENFNQSLLIRLDKIELSKLSAEE